MNLLEGDLVRHEGKLHVRAGGLEVSLPDNEFSDAERAVTLGIRPEHIARACGRHDALMHVDIVEQIGAQTYVIGTVFGQRVRAVFDRDDELKTDVNVPVNLPAPRLHVFSRESGMSLRSSIA
jgi:multiple sugar transport system ATP-binding protein